MLNFVISAFLLGAVICDVSSHRLPNWLLLFGLLVALTLQVWLNGISGLGYWVAGLLTGLVLLLPLYILGGMAAGDVKLMAVVGSFLGSNGALWAGSYSLMVGAILGIIYLICKGHLGRFAMRYWVMAITRCRIQVDENDAARHRFPYAVAIAAGTLLSMYMAPI